MNSPYAYVLWALGEQAVFTWPNCAKKYIRDTYTADGELRLPPADLIILTRFRVNPKAGQGPSSVQLDVEKFLAS